MGQLQTKSIPRQNNAVKLITALAVLFLSSACDLQSGDQSEKKAPVIKSENSLTVDITGPYDFGLVKLGESSTITVTLKSLSSEEVVKDIKLPNLYAPFELIESTNTCTETLAPEQSCSFEVEFSPFTAEEYSTSLTIRYLNSTHYINRVFTMSAKAYTDTTLSYESKTWNLGLFPIGIKSDSISFRILHTGNLAAENFSIGNLDSPFSFNGDSFPGLNGSCEDNIERSCFLDFAYTSSSPSFSSKTLSFAYTINGESFEDELLLFATSAIVFGSTDLNKINAHAHGLSKPTHIFTVNTDVYVVDSNSNRVLVFDGIPSSESSPKFVLGQESESIVSENKGNLVASLSSLKNPRHGFSDGKSLVISDTGNDRVLYWETLPTSNSQPASASFEGLSSPQAAIIFDGKLVVADTDNSRVVTWELEGYTPLDPFEVTTLAVDTPVSLLADGENLWIVNRGALNNVVKYSTPFETPSELVRIDSAETPPLNTPSSINMLDGLYYITDSASHHVLVYSNIPSNNPGPSHILGTTAINSPSDATLNAPGGLTLFSGSLLLADTENNRIIGWSSVPSTSNPNADIVIGQMDFLENKPYYQQQTESTLTSPRATIFGGHVITADKEDGRLLYYQPGFTSSNPTSDLILDTVTPLEASYINDGATDYTYVAENDSPNLYYSSSKPIAFDYVASISAAQNIVSLCSNSAYLYAVLQNGDIERYFHGAPPSLDATITHPSLTNPTSIDCNETFVTVTNTSTSQVFVFEKTAAAPLEAADPPNYTVSSFSSGSISSPLGAATSASGVLVISDTDNRRLLIWDEITSLGNDPTFFLGQKNLATVIHTTTRNTFAKPAKIVSSGNQFIVSDLETRRVTIIGEPVAP